MILEAIKTIVPPMSIPWVILLMTMLWLGWESHAVYGVVKLHTERTEQTYKYARETCHAVQILARLDPAKCEEQ